MIRSSVLVFALLCSLFFSRLAFADAAQIVALGPKIDALAHSIDTAQGTFATFQDTFNKDFPLVVGPAKDMGNFAQNPNVYVNIPQLSFGNILLYTVAITLVVDLTRYCRKKLVKRLDGLRGSLCGKRPVEQREANKASQSVDPSLVTAP